MIRVRPAGPADVAAMSVVLTASITELCSADHRDDPARVARWTANKTPGEVGKMLANPANRMFVAEHDGVVAAVGCIRGASEVGLNYVHPAHRFAGVSKALLGAMEDAIAGGGASEATLDSTTTAHRFYLGAGWRDVGDPQEHFGLTCFAMRKRLSPDAA